MKYWRKPLDQDRIITPHYKINVLKDRCKGCRLCIEFCPRKVLRESTDFNARGYHSVCAEKESECLHCGLCELICPEFAIEVVPAEAEKTNA